MPKASLISNTSTAEILDRHLHLHIHIVTTLLAEAYIADFDGRSHTGTGAYSVFL